MSKSAPWSRTPEPPQQAKRKKGKIRETEPKRDNVQRSPTLKTDTNTNPERHPIQPQDSLMLPQKTHHTQKECDHACPTEDAPLPKTDLAITVPHQCPLKTPMSRLVVQDSPVYSNDPPQPTIGSISVESRPNEDNLIGNEHVCLGVCNTRTTEKGEDESDANKYLSGSGL